MQSDDPPFLPVGTQVSAKFKGAFCEAKIKKVKKDIKCKANVGGELLSGWIDEKDIKGTMAAGGSVEVTQGKQSRPGTITHVKDCSTYLVVFDDGDEKSLRRTQIRLMGGRHFEQETSLDSLPLYNPDHFSNPVVVNKRLTREQRSLSRARDERSMSRTPLKRKARGDFSSDEEEEEVVDRRKQRTAASVAAAAISGHGDDSDEERERADTSADEREKSEKANKMKTPQSTPSKKRKEEKEDEKKREKEEEKKKKEKEERKKEKEEMKKKKEEETPKKDEKKKESPRKEKREKKEEKEEKEDKKSEKKEDKTQKTNASPKKLKETEKAKEKPEPAKKVESSKPKEKSKQAMTREEEEEAIKKPGATVVVSVNRGSGPVYYPAISCCLEAYRKNVPKESFKACSEGQLILKSLSSNIYARVENKNVSLWQCFDHAKWGKTPPVRSKDAIAAAEAYHKKKILPKDWTHAQLIGEEAAARLEEELKLKSQAGEQKKKGKEEVKKKEEEKSKEKEKEEERKKEKVEEKKKEKEKDDEKLKETLKKKKEEEKKRKEKEEEEEMKEKKEEERKKKEKEEEKREKEKERERKEKERERKEKEKEKEKEREKKEREKEKKAKKQAESEQEEEGTEDEDSGESSEEDEEDKKKMEAERDVFIAALYKFHEERSTPINKLPRYENKDLDLYLLYCYVKRKGGPRRVNENGEWPRVVRKLGLEGLKGATPASIKSAYNRLLKDLHDLYSKLGTNLADISTNIASGERSAKRPVNYSLKRPRRERKERGSTKHGEAESSVRSGETSHYDFDDGSSVLNDADESLRHLDVSDTRRSLSRLSDELPSTSGASAMAMATPVMKRGKKSGKEGWEKRSRGDETRSSIRTVSESTEPALASGSADDGLSTVSSSGALPFTPPSAPSIYEEGTTPSGSAPSADSAHSSDKDTTWSHDIEPHDGHLPANLFSRFRQGMTVLAFHTVGWYPARVVKITQPPLKAVIEAIERAMTGDVKVDAGQPFGFSSLHELREMTKKSRCYVHYLGWNLRYDEYTKLPQMRIQEKEDVASMAHVKSTKLSKEALEWAAKWMRSEAGMAALCGGRVDRVANEVLQNMPIGGPGGHRARRVSHSLPDQPSATSSPLARALSPPKKGEDGREKRRDEKGEEETEQEASMSTVVEKKEKKEKKDEKEKEEGSSLPSPSLLVTRRKEEEERKDRKRPLNDSDEREEQHLRTKQAKMRTPSPSKFASLASNDAATPPALFPSPSDRPTAAADRSAAGAAGREQQREREEKPANTSMIDDTIDSVLLSLNVRNERERKARAEMERVERERMERDERERARKEEEAAALAARIAEAAASIAREEKEKREREEKEEKERRKEEREREKERKERERKEKEKEREKREKEEREAKEREETRMMERQGRLPIFPEQSTDEEEQKTEKEARADKRERHKGGKDREKDVEVKAKKKKNDEKEKKKAEKLQDQRKKMEEEEEDGEEKNEVYHFVDEEVYEEIIQDDAVFDMQLNEAGDILIAESLDKEREESERAEEAEKKEGRKPCRLIADFPSTSIRTTINKVAPASASAAAKGKKRKKNGNQSNMVLDRKTGKKRKRTAADTDDEEDDLPSILAERPAHSALSVLKTKMLRAMEADGSVNDFAPLGLPHITHRNLYGERVDCDFAMIEEHTREMKEYYAQVRMELARLDKRNKATIKRGLERDREEKREKREAKRAEAAAAAFAASSTAAAKQALIAEI